MGDAAACITYTRSSTITILNICTCWSRQWLSSMHFFNLGMSDRPAYLSADYSVPCSNLMKQLWQFAVLEKRHYSTAGRHSSGTWAICHKLKPISRHLKMQLRWNLVTVLPCWWAASPRFNTRTDAGFGWLIRTRVAIRRARGRDQLARPPLGINRLMKGVSSDVLVDFRGN